MTAPRLPGATWGPAKPWRGSNTWAALDARGIAVVYHTEAVGIGDTVRASPKGYRGVLFSDQENLGWFDADPTDAAVDIYRAARSGRR